MKGFAIYKAKKLLKVSLEHDGSKIQSVKIHGDFFLYPEEKIGELENALEGTPIQKEAIEAKVGAFLQEAEAFGFEPADIAAAILQAAGGEKK